MKEEGDNYDVIEEVAMNDVAQLREKGKSYGTSWRNRGGVGAFMMLARKWDRLENAAKVSGYDIFKLVAEDMRKEGVIDDIRDLRRYLLLVESHLLLENDNLRMDVVDESEEYRGADHE